MPDSDVITVREEAIHDLARLVRLAQSNREAECIISAWLAGYRAHGPGAAALAELALERQLELAADLFTPPTAD